MCIPCRASKPYGVYSSGTCNRATTNRSQIDRRDVQSSISHPMYLGLRYQKFNSSFLKSVGISHVFSFFSTEIERARHSEIRFERTQTKDVRFNSNNSCCYEFGANQRLVRYKETFLDVLRSKVDRERLRSHFLGNLRFCSKNTPTECVQYEISLLQT